MLPANQLINERKSLYDGVKAIFGLGDAISGASRGRGLRGLIEQISGKTSPKTGLFQDRILKKKQDFSGRATIYAEPNLGFNEAAIPNGYALDAVQVSYSARS
jgi:DNA-directed RNA polymerase beta' subunit